MLLDKVDSNFNVKSFRYVSLRLGLLLQLFIREVMKARKDQYDERDMREIMKDKNLGTDQEGIEINV